MCAPFIPHIAEQNKVSEARLIETILKRRAYRRAKMYRERSRKRQLERNPKAKRLRRDTRKARYAGEGEFHGLLRALGMSESDYARLSGTSQPAVNRWFGHPLNDAPCQLLRYYGWANNMAAYLREHGVDPDRFKVQPVTNQWKNGRYPRKADQHPSAGKDDE